MNKIELIERIARNLNDLEVMDSPATASLNSITANGLIHPQVNQLQGYNLWFYGNISEGTASRVVSSFDPTTNRLTVGQNFTNAPSTGGLFMLFERFRGEDYENAFRSAYSRFYDTRNNVLSEWEQWVNGITQRQLQWKNEKQADIDAWVVYKKEEQNQWYNQQVNWASTISDEWRSFISSQPRGFGFRVPTLGIYAAGTLSIGTIPVGSLHVPTLSLPAVPTISSLGSYGSTVLDDSILIDSMEQNLLVSRLQERKDWQTKYESSLKQMNSSVQQEQNMLTNLKETTSLMWNQHKSEFDITWATHKDKYEKNFSELQSSYTQHKADISSRWVEIQRIIKGV